MRLLDVFIISGWVNFIFSLSWGLFVFFKNYKDKINLIFLLLTISIAIWSLGYANWIGATSYNKAFLWLQVLNLGSFIIPWLYLLWVSYFCNYFANISKFIFISGVFIAALLFLYIINPHLFVVGLNKKLIFNFWPTAGPFYKFYIIFDYLTLALIGCGILFINFTKASTKEDKLKYLITILTAILGFLGGSTNFFLWYDVHILPWGNLLVAIFPIIFGWSTLQIRLFNIRILAVEFFVYLINIISIARIFYYRNYLELIFNSVFALLLLTFSIMLLRSAIKEVEQREKLEELNKIKSEFLSFASHQVKSPMAVVKGYAELIAEGIENVPEQAKDFARKIKEAVGNLLILVEEFMDYRRIEENKMEFKFEEVEIVSFIRKIVEDLRILAEEKKLQLTFEINLNEAFVKIDKVRFAQVIQNLIDNAIKYTPQGFVKVSLEKKQNEILISVIDTGIGMSKELQQKLFGQFVRDPSIKREIRGTGLGLYIAKYIVEAHHGKIWAESEGIGKGSRFFVSLPISEFDKV
jgi:signal transduction histidine kinase